MSYTNNIIEAPVGLADIVAALRENTADLGSLCQSKSINVWAKYKPVKNSEKEYESQLDTARTGWADTATWWKGYNGQCGIDLGTYLTSDLTADDMAAWWKGAWKHDAPTGTGDYPWYRQEDFLKYKRDAVSPFGTLTSRPDPAEKYYQGGSKLTWVITPHSPADGELAFKDIRSTLDTNTDTTAGFSSWHFGMLFVCTKVALTSNTATYVGRKMIKTCAEQIGNGGTTLELTTADTAKFSTDLNTDTTDWIAYPIITQIAVTELTELSAANAGTIYAAPYRQAIVDGSQAYEFQPSLFNISVQGAMYSSNSSSAAYGYVAAGAGLYFYLSIVNWEQGDVVIDKLADITYTVEGQYADGQWNTAWSHTFADGTTKMNTTSTTAASVTGGITVESGGNVTLHHKYIVTDTANWNQFIQFRITVTVNYSKDGTAKSSQGLVATAVNESFNS